MFVDDVREHLVNSIIPFWKGMKDSEYGGYYGWLDYQLQLDKKALKGVILNSRILWFFSNAYLLLKDESLLVEAKHAYEFLKNHCIDQEYGGVYWALYYDGAPFDRTKHIYNHAFAIYALSSYYDASKDPNALQLAWDLYHIVEDKCRDDHGYIEEQNEKFQWIPNVLLSDNGVLADRTMNSLLHIFEAYSELYRVTKDPKVKDRMNEILTIFTEKIYRKDMRRLEVFFDPEWNSILDLQSYGHDIEVSWLLDEGCQLLGESELTKQVEEMNSVLAESVYERAYVNHSLISECEKGKKNPLRIWWVQCEAILGFMNHYQKYPEQTKYKEAAMEIWQYVMENMVDKRSGSEWFWQLFEDGTPDPNRAIVEPFKCPYHNGRMCMELIKRGGELGETIRD